MRLDAFGFFHAALPEISWRDVQGVDLHAQRLGNGRTRWCLVFALSDCAWTALRPARWKRWIHWITPQADMERPVLTVSCRLASASPQALLEVAKKIADTAGAPRSKAWCHDEPIESAKLRDALATQVEEAKERVDHLMSRAMRTSRSTMRSAEEIAVLETQVEQAMCDVSRALDAQAEVSDAMRAQMHERFDKKYKKAIIAMGLCAAVLAFQAVYAWWK